LKRTGRRRIEGGRKEWERIVEREPGEKEEVGPSWLR
jgi:hypothetical protein